MAANRIKGITIEIGGDTTNLVSSLKKVDSQIKNTQTTLKDVNKLLKLDPGNTELLKQKQAQLNDAIGLTKDRLEQLKDAQSQVGQGTAEWDALQREILETEQNLGGLQKELSDFGSVTAQKIKVVGEKFQEVGGKIENAGKALSKVSAVAAGALGGIGKLGYDAVVAADDLNTLSKQTGVSTDQLQKWSYAADLVDVDVNTITSSMKKMKKGLDSNSDAFKTLGVRTKDNYGNMRDATDIFYDTIKALSQIDNETERDIAAMDIFGKSADDLAGIIDDGGQALINYGREAEKMGLIIGGDTLNKLNEANDTIDKMKATVGASMAQAGATIAQTFAPAMEKVVGVIDAVSEKIRNLTPEQAKIITTILAIVAAVSPLLIILAKVVSAISFVMTHITAISAVLSALTGPIGIIIAAVAALTAAFIHFYKTNDEFREKVNAVVDAVKEKLGVFIENLKVWIAQAIEYIRPIIEALQGYFSALGEMFGAIATQVATVIGQIAAVIKQFITEHQTEIQAVMTFIETVVKTKIEIIRTIIKTVLDVVTNMIKVFTAIIKGDWDGALTHLKNAAISLKDGVVSIFRSLGNALSTIFKDIIGKFKQWGADMINNLISGIKSKIDAVKDTMSNVADAIREFIHFSEPDVGPLSDFHTYAPDMMKLFADGIKQNAHLITDAVGSSFDLRPYINSMTSGINKLTNVTSSTLDSKSQTQPVVVQVSLEGDAQRLFRVLSEEAHRDWQVTGQSRLLGY